MDAWKRKIKKQDRQHKLSVYKSSGNYDNFKGKSKGSLFHKKVKKTEYQKNFPKRL